MFNRKTYPTILCIVFCIFCIISCLEEEYTKPNQFNHFDYSEHEFEKSSSAANELNPYDYIGEAWYGILSDFMSDDPLAETLNDADLRIRSLLDDYELPPDSATIPQVLQDLINTPLEVIDSILLNTSISTNLKKEIYDYLDQTTDIDTTDMDDILEYSIAFEINVMNHSGYTNEEKRIFLTLASVTRYVCFYSKGRDDKDWDVSVGNRGALIGALENGESALYLALLSYVCKNLEIDG